MNPVSLNYTLQPGVCKTVSKQNKTQNESLERRSMLLSKCSLFGPSTHVRWLTTVYNSSFRRSNTVTHTCRKNTNSHAIINKSSRKKEETRHCLLLLTAIYVFGFWETGTWGLANSLRVSCNFLTHCPVTHQTILFPFFLMVQLLGVDSIIDVLRTLLMYNECLIPMSNFYFKYSEWSISQRNSPWKSMLYLEGGLW